MTDRDKPPATHPYRDAADERERARPRPLTISAADLTGRYGRGARNFAGAVLRWAELSEAELPGILLWHADLQRCELRRTNLRGADLRQANLRRAYLYNADLREADLQGADLREATLVDADIQGANLLGADLRSAALHSSRYDDDTRFPADFDPDEAGMEREGWWRTAIEGMVDG